MVVENSICINNISMHESAACIVVVEPEIFFCSLSLQGHGCASRSGPHRGRGEFFPLVSMLEQRPHRYFLSSSNIYLFPITIYQLLMIDVRLNIPNLTNWKFYLLRNCQVEIGEHFRQHSAS
jgi:hypothetical protein